MFINFWYVACQSGDLKFGAGRPLKTTMLGSEFALWRDTKGVAHCVGDTCVHRGGSLGEGRVRGDCIECPYHGWTFAADGSCVRLPSLGGAATIPDRARVDAYPVVERYGMVWVFLGDLPEDERPPIIEIPDYGQPGWRSIILQGDWPVDYKRAVENIMDPAHSEFTHPSQGFLGVKDDDRVPEIALMDSEWGTGFMSPMETPPLPQRDMREASGKLSEGRAYVGSGNHGPNCTWTFVHISESLKMHNYVLHTPLHEKLDRWYLVALRNNLLDPRYDSTIADRAVFTSGQDEAVLVPIRPRLTPRANAHEFLVPADKAIVRYREYCRAWEERGWRIDGARLRADIDTMTYAIPGPARRQRDGWVLPAVPLVPGVAVEPG